MYPGKNLLLLLVLLHCSSFLQARQAEEPGPPKPQFLVKAAHQDGISSVVLSPDEKTIASLGADHELKLWSVDGKLLGRQRVKNFEVGVNVVFSADGKTLAVGEEDGHLALIDAAHGNLKKRRRCHDKRIFCVAYSPDGRLLATASLDGTIRLWDIQTDKEVAQLPSGNGGNFAFSPDSSSLAVPSNQGIQLWNLTTLKVQRRFYEKGFLHTDAFFADSGKVLIGELSQHEQGACLWDVATGKVKETVFGYFTPDAPMAVSPDGLALLTSESHSLKVWDLSSGQLLQRLTHFDYTLTNGTISLGRRGIAVGNRDGVLAYYLRETQHEKTLIPPLRQDSVRLAGTSLERLSLGRADWIMERTAFSQDGKKLYIAGKHHEVPESAHHKSQNAVGFVRVWDIAARKEVASFPPAGGMRFGRYQGLLEPVLAFAASPDDKLLAVATEKAITLWDIRTRKELCVIDDLERRHIQGLVFLLYNPSMTFSSDGRLLAISDPHGTWIWDVESRKVIAQAKEGGHVSFFGRDKFFATAMYHNRVKLWETSTGKELAEDHPEMGILYEGSISSDSGWLAACGEGGALIWKIVDLETKPRLERHRRLPLKGPTYGIDVSHDGRCVLTAPYLWETQTGKELAHLATFRSSVRGRLSPDGNLAAFPAGSVVYLWRLDGVARK